ncbi:ATP phosphoribosyltransferase [bacterium]|nr:ATP phosphoribosyltransferase [bacterium]
MAKLTMAVPVDRTQGELVTRLRELGFCVPDVNVSCVPEPFMHVGDDYSYVFSNCWDTIAFVEDGFADFGICGLDVVLESKCLVYEPARLPFSFGRVSIIGNQDFLKTPLRYRTHLRVGTRYPRLARDYFAREESLNVNILEVCTAAKETVHMGLCDLSVDLLSSATSVREPLVEYKVILEAQAVLIVNRSAYRLNHKQLQEITHSMRKIGGGS